MKTWIHRHTLESEQQSMQWKHVSYPTPTKAEIVNSAGKVMMFVFSGPCREFSCMVDFPQKGRDINAEYYTHLLEELREKIRELRPGLLRKTHLSSRQCASQYGLLSHGENRIVSLCKIMDHPPSSPDLAPSDFHLYSPD